MLKLLWISQNRTNTYQTKSRYFFARSHLQSLITFLTTSLLDSGFCPVLDVVLESLENSKKLRHLVEQYYVVHSTCFSISFIILLFGIWFGSHMHSSFQTNEIASCHNSCASKHGHCSMVTVLKPFVITSKRILSLKKEVQLQRSCRWSNCNQVSAYGGTTYLIDIAQNTIVILNLVAVFC